MMGTASLQFIAYGLAVAVMSNLNQSVAWRQIVLFVASIGFLSFFSQSLATFVPLSAFLAFGFVGVRLLQSSAKRAFVAILFTCIIAFVWLKKYAFVPSALYITRPYLTLGLSYIFFRVLHLIIDAHGDDLPDKITAPSYLNYTLNFTTLVSGPIQSYQDFAKMQLAKMPLTLNVVVVSESLERIILGFFKVNVLSLFLSMAQTAALSSSAAHTTGDGLVSVTTLAVALYPFYLYCNFSGYIDIVLGLARLLRIELPENFNRPFSSENFLIFWNRWHMTLSNWLKTYVYNPLIVVGMQRWPSTKAEPYIVVLAFFSTFFLIGVWHGQTTEFLFYGILLGLGVSVNKLYQILLVKRLGRAKYNKLAKNPVYRTAARGLTFTWFSFSLLWFWSNWKQISATSGALSPLQLAAVWIAIWAGSAIALGVWEIVRRCLFSFTFEDRPLVSSRYIRTIFTTAIMIIIVLTLSLLNAPAPDIVYKAF